MKETSIPLTAYRPISKLKTAKTVVETPKYRVIDAHNHLNDAFGGGWCHRPVDDLLAVLDEAKVDLFVDLDGGWGEDILIARLKKYKAHTPERFMFFGGVSWKDWSDKGRDFGTWAAQRLRVQIDMGAQGLKIWKLFGLSVRDHEGQVVAVDDERLDPVWEAAADLRIPVLIHVADPVSFFDPIDISNERYEELQAHPDWQFPSPPFPAFQKIMDDFSNLVHRHSETIFIGAHVGCYAENLAWVSDLLEACPNLYVDISGRINELGRQPFTSKKFFLKHAERILFGIDEPASLDWYRLYYRFLETEDEYFSYEPAESYSKGRWRIYGLGLPDEVLRKVYYENAKRVLMLDRWGISLPHGSEKSTSL